MLKKLVFGILKNMGRCKTREREKKGETHNKRNKNSKQAKQQQKKRTNEQKEKLI